MKIKSFLMTTLGFILIGFGAVGVLIPVWPTTPFVLCAIGCFAGNPRMREAMLKINFVREHFENYQNRCGLSKKTVKVSLGYLWGMLIISSILIQKWWIVLMLLLIGSAVTAHILWIAKAKT